ncbi:hypothetical protein EIP86_001107 [Pleurotus ostreatoroseus]|nr:hypothetical protein EIP86_001107 [Pleurotus ostreatoroseus]
MDNAKQVTEASGATSERELSVEKEDGTAGVTREQSLSSLSSVNEHCDAEEHPDGDQTSGSAEYVKETAEITDHKQQSPQPQVDEEETVQGETNVTESNDGTKTLDSEVQNQANNGNDSKPTEDATCCGTAAAATEAVEPAELPSVDEHDGREDNIMTEAQHDEQVQNEQINAEIVEEQSDKPTSEEAEKANVGSIDSTTHRRSSVASPQDATPKETTTERTNEEATAIEANGASDREISKEANSEIRIKGKRTAKKTKEDEHTNSENGNATDHDSNVEDTVVERTTRKRTNSRKEQKSPKRKAQQSPKAHVDVERNSDDLISKPTNFSGYRSWKAIPEIDEAKIPSLKRRVQQIRKKKLLKAVTWRNQTEARIEAFYTAVKESCGQDLAEYEDCWPAEAVTRDSLINQRRRLGGDINEEEEYGENQPQKSTTAKNNKSRSDNDTGKKIGTTAATRSTTSRKRKRVIVIEDDSEDEKPKKRTAVVRTVRKANKSEAEEVASVEGEPNESDDNHSDDRDGNDKPTSSSSNMDTRKRRREDAHAEEDVPEAKKTMGRKKVRKITPEERAELEEMFDDEHLVDLLADGGIRTAKDIKRMSGWKIANIGYSLGLMGLSAFQIGQVIEQVDREYLKNLRKRPRSI